MENTNNEVGRNLWRETINTLIAAGKAHALHADAVVKAARDIEEIIESAIPAKAGKLPRGWHFVLVRTNVGSRTYLANADGDLAGPDADKYLYGDFNAQVRTHLRVARKLLDDVADGLLEEIATWLTTAAEKDAARVAEAQAILHQRYQQNGDHNE